MKFIIIFLFLPCKLCAQNRFTCRLKNDDLKSPIGGVSVIIKKLKKLAISDSSGFVQMNNIPDGNHLIEFSHVGYKELEKIFHFPLKDLEPIEMYLEPEMETLQEVKVTTTRSNRSIGTTPSRVEIISDEEIHEEGEMRPGDIKMLLSESTGVQTQQTSATSGNASLRLQGLDGRYTQILKDGFPIYSGAASGLGLLQTPPLDLRQVEIIKGSASTLYGGGAIAGLINLISKVPQSKRELSFQINGTTAKGLDINSFYSQQFDEMGITVFAARNSNAAYAPSNTLFTAIPEFERYTLNPKFFFNLNARSKISVGINSSFENRLGGDIKYIEGKGDSLHQYYERNKTKRISSELSLNHNINETSSFNFKNSISYFDREIDSKGYNFSGVQNSTFSEASYLNKHAKSDWIAGLNVVTDAFHQKPNATGIITDFSQTTVGAFVQNTWNANSYFTLETGLRSDYIKDYGVIILPRISGLFKLDENLTSRIGGGFGYKTPSIFTEETERLLYKNILPVNNSNSQLEKSYGVNGDLNYKFQIEKLKVNVNQLFFYTYLFHPLQLFTTAGNFYQLRNNEGNLHSKGTESNVRLSYNETSLYLGYTFTDAKIVGASNSIQQPLTPKHRLNAALVYEMEGKWKFGSELYYFSPQLLTTGENGRAYWLSGLVVERLLKNISLYVNFENFGDVRQSRFENIYDGSITNPVFKDIYAPLEGFIANAGVEIKL